MDLSLWGVLMDPIEVTVEEATFGPEGSHSVLSINHRFAGVVRLSMNTGEMEDIATALAERLIALKVWQAVIIAPDPPEEAESLDDYVRDTWAGGDC